VSAVLASLCGDRFGARPRVSDFDTVLPLTVAFLAITAAALGFRASQRHGYGPLWLGLIAATTILAGKFYFDVAQAAYVGVALLIGASVWNSWPRRAVTIPACPACVAAGASSNERMDKENS